MAKRIRRLFVVVACAAMAMTYGVGAAEAPSPVTAADTPAATVAPPACSFSVFASGLTGPGPMVFSGTDLYVATWIQSTERIEIVRVTAGGSTSVFATIDTAGAAAIGSGFSTDLAVDGSGNLYVAAGHTDPGKYWKVTTAGVVSAVASDTARGPASIEFDSAGNLYAADVYSDTILKNGASFAGSGGDFGLSNGLIWGTSALYALFQDSVKQVSAAGSFSLVADLGTLGSPTFALRPGSGVFYFLIYTADGSNDLVAKVAPSGSPANVCDLGFADHTVNDMEFGADGALYLSDYNNGRILKLSVPTPAQEVEGLMDDVNGLNLPPGTTNSLTAKLDGALDSLAAGQTGAAKGKLKAFINEVNAKCCVPHPGKTLTQEEADALIAVAESALASLA